MYRTPWCTVVIWKCDNLGEKKKKKLNKSFGCDWDETLWQNRIQLLSSPASIYAWYPFCLHILLPFDTTCANALNRRLPPRLLSIRYYYCQPHPTRPSHASPPSLSPSRMSPLNSHSDLWLLILYLSTRRTGAREMTCFRLGWKDTQAGGKAPLPPSLLPTASPPFTLTHTHTHADATEAASGAQCNYGETEQSVTHLSAAGIRAELLLRRWRGKPGVSLLKHSDRQLHPQTAARADRPNIWIEDRLWGRALTEDREVTRQTTSSTTPGLPFNACESTNVENKCLWAARRQKKSSRGAVSYSRTPTLPVWLGYVSHCGPRMASLPA